MNMCMYSNVCMHVCIVCVYTCVHVPMCICMYVYMYACVPTCTFVHACMYVIFKLGFERYGRGNCPSWRGNVQGVNCPGELSEVELSGGKCPFPWIGIPQN